MVALLSTALIAIGVLSGAIFVIVSQPRPVWNDVAEHAKSFWYSWPCVNGNGEGRQRCDDTLTPR